MASSASQCWTLAIAADDPPGGCEGVSSERTAGRPSSAWTWPRRASCTAPSSATRAEASTRNDRGTNSLRSTAATASATGWPSGEPSKIAARSSRVAPMSLAQPGKTVDEAIVEPPDQFEGLVDAWG